MSMIDVAFLSAVTATQPAAQTQRAVSDAAAQQFREALAKPNCAGEGCSVQQADGGNLLPMLDLDIEKVVMSSLPSPSASPAEFAVGMLRATIRLQTASVAIEMASNTTHSLTQGVQTLTSR